MKKVKSTLTASMLAFLVCGVAQADLDDGLVAYYPFDGNAVDSTGNGNDGLEVDGVSYNEGISNQSASFNGIDGEIHFPFSSISNAPAGTISLWVRFNDENKQYNIFADENYTLIFIYIINLYKHNYLLDIFFDPILLLNIY